MRLAKLIAYCNYIWKCYTDFPKPKLFPIFQIVNEKNSINEPELNRAKMTGFPFEELMKYYQHANTVQAQMKILYGKEYN